MNKKPQALICGLPSSGNGLIADLINNSGGKAVVHHADDRIQNPNSEQLEHLIQAAFMDTPRGIVPQIIIPVRAIKPWRLSVANRWDHTEGQMIPVLAAGGWANYRVMTRKRLFSAITRKAFIANPQVVSYEGLVQDPMNAALDILHPMGLTPYSAWAVKVNDQNRKYNPEPFRGYGPRMRYSARVANRKTSGLSMPQRWTPLRHHDKQVAMAEDESRIVVCAAGRRSGKTERAKRKLVREAVGFPVKRPDLPDGFFYATAPTFAQAKKIYWKDLKSLVPHVFVRRIYEADLIISLHSGVELAVAGLDKPERLEGSPIDGVVIDEIANCKPEAWTSNIRPALDTEGREGWAWLIGVPEGAELRSTSCGRKPGSARGGHSTIGDPTPFYPLRPSKRPSET